MTTPSKGQPYNTGDHKRLVIQRTKKPRNLEFCIQKNYPSKIKEK
jgi:hypothetical protein